MVIYKKSSLKKFTMNSRGNQRRVWSRVCSVIETQFKCSVWLRLNGEEQFQSLSIDFKYISILRIRDFHCTMWKDSLYQKGS